MPSLLLPHTILSCLLSKGLFSKSDSRVDKTSEYGDRKDPSAFPAGILQGHLAVGGTALHHAPGIDPSGGSGGSFVDGQKRPVGRIDATRGVSPVGDGPGKAEDIPEPGFLTPFENLKDTSLHYTGKDDIHLFFIRPKKDE